MTYDLSRIRPVFDAEPHTMDHSPGISIVGCGAIGSRVAHLLCDIGLGEKLVLHDPDVVELHNLSSALYNSFNVGSFKVDALANALYQKWGKCVMATRQFAVERRGSCGSGIVITCLDSMKARRQVMGTALFLDGHAKWVMDARITATTIFAIGYDIRDPVQHRQYMEELYDDPSPAADAAMGGCNQKTSVASTAAMAASLLVQLFINRLNKVDGPNEIVVSLRDWTMEARRYARAGE